MNKPKIGDIIYTLDRSCYCVIDQIIEKNNGDFEYRGIWSDDGKRNGVLLSDYIYDDETIMDYVVPKEIAESSLFKIMNEIDWQLINFMLN